MLSCLPLLFTLFAHSQYNNEYNEGIGSLRIGGGYTRDFPGLNGYTLRGEFSRSLNDYLDGAFAVQRTNANGYPRTGSVREYTKATAIDFNLYLLPLKTDVHVLRLGVGYSFSFYTIRRSYPLSNVGQDDKNYTWPVDDRKGRKSGLSISGEYEYFLPGSGVSLGIRASLFKAYDQVSYFGPFVGVRL